MSVYKVVPHPKGKNVVGSKWVFRIKRGPDGAILKHKARVVAQGFTQIEGVNYDETFAPVAKLASLRTILAIAAELDLEVHQMDVKSAYLNGELKEDIYMKPPPGFEVPDRHGTEACQSVVQHEARRKSLVRKHQKHSKLDGI
jgi:hypothetical protein